MTINLASSQYTAPGVYLAETLSTSTSPSIVGFNAAYIFGEVSFETTTSVSKGFPFNTPISISSLEEFEFRLSEGDLSTFVRPTKGTTLTSYNAVKQFFRNSNPGSGVNLYFIRVKPQDVFVYKVTQPPTLFEVTSSEGVSEAVYGYPLSINNVRLGRVDYDNLGNFTHIGVEVEPNVTLYEARDAIARAILSSSLASNIVLQNENGGSFSYNESVDFNLATEPKTAFCISSSGSSNNLKIDNLYLLSLNAEDDAPVTGGLLYQKKDVGDDVSVRIEDYVYSIEKSIDPSVFPPGFLLAPSGFAKFNPQDRQRLSVALENLAANIDYCYMAIVDCGTPNGLDIADFYRYPVYSAKDAQYAQFKQDATESQDNVFFIKELNQFYQLKSNNDAYYGSSLETLMGLDTIYMARYLVDKIGVELKYLFNNTNNVNCSRGDILTEFNSYNTYVVLQDFRYINSPGNIISIGGRDITNTTVNDHPLTDYYAERIALKVKLPASSEVLTTLTPGSIIPSGSYIAADLVDGTGGAGSVYLVRQDIVVPSGSTTFSYNPSELGVPGIYVVKGQLVEVNKNLYIALQNFDYQDTTQTPDELVRLGFLSRTIPDLYVQEFVKDNESRGVISPLYYDPTGDQTVTYTTGSNLSKLVPYNCNSHADLTRDYQLHTTRYGYLAYYAPYVVDLEGYNNPASSSVVGAALRSFRERGFYEPVGGVHQPLRGVLRPQFTITRSHQQATNPFGLNAIRIIPNQGTLIWGARTRSKDNLFRWINTRIIVNVVINSLRNVFDDKIFRSIDGVQTLFREIRSTAENILYRLYVGGALYGANPSDAYKVVCNSSNNPDFQLEDGVINVEIFVVPVSTLEIISIAITRTAIGGLSASVGAQSE